jgi:hypothetical protein
VTIAALRAFNPVSAAKREFSIELQIWGTPI